MLDVVSASKHSKSSLRFFIARECLFGHAHISLLLLWMSLFLHESPGLSNRQNLYRRQKPSSTFCLTADGQWLMIPDVVSLVHRRSAVSDTHDGNKQISALAPQPAGIAEVFVILTLEAASDEILRSVI